jgi:putative acetyltransferase
LTHSSSTLRGMDCSRCFERERRPILNIRPFSPGDEPALHAVFQSAVRGLTTKDYSPEQVDAWASAGADPGLWARRMQEIRPFVVAHEGGIVAYADVQPSGYIDHFFVSAPHAGTGVGSLLMRHLHRVAAKQSVVELTSQVSFTARPFFERFGFAALSQQSPVIRGVVIPNVLMRKGLG